MSIAIHRFFTDYGPLKEEVEITDKTTGEPRMARRRVPGKTAELHKVVYGPLGSDRTRVTAFVHHLKPKIPREMAERGTAAEQAWYKWDIIEAAYKKWLAGQEITPEGTPLAAWSGVGPEQAAALKSRDIHTVEQLAQLTDSHIEKYGIAGLRHLRDNAKRFLTTLDKATVENALAEKDVLIAGLTDTVEEMRQAMAEMRRSMASLQTAQPAPGDGGHLEQDVNNDDAFGGGDDIDTTDAVPVTTPRRRARA